MPHLITFSSFMLFWIFYAISGGADFEPRERVVVSQSPFKNGSEDDRPIFVVNNGPAETLNTVAFAVVEPQPALVSFPTETTNDIAKANEAETTSAAEQPLAMLFVAGTRVNLRAGPGTNHAVLKTISGGTKAELVSRTQDGWARIRLTEDGQIGWMVDRLLAES